MNIILLKDKNSIKNYDYEKFLENEEIHLTISDSFIKLHSNQKIIQDLLKKKVISVIILKYEDSIENYETISVLLSNSSIKTLNIYYYSDKMMKSVFKNISNQLKNLTLTFFNRKETNLLWNLKYLRNLEYLTIRDVHFQNVNNFQVEFNKFLKKSISTMSKLKRITLWNSDFGSNFNFTVNFGSINLNFILCRLNFFGMAKMNRNLKSFQVIARNESDLYNNISSVFELIQENQSLERLHFSHNSGMLPLCKSLKDHKKLKELIIESVAKSDDDTIILHNFLKENKSLKLLSLNDNLKNLNNLDTREYKSLIYLDINNGMINNFPIISDQIERLTIFKSQASNEEFNTFIQSLNECKSLKELSLYFHIDQINVLMNYLPKLNLKSLTLKWVNVNVKEILQSLQYNQNIQYLNLDYKNDIDQIDIQEILDEFFIYNCKVISLKIQNRSFQIKFNIEHFLKRNNEILKIESLIKIKYFEKDINFHFH